MDLLSKDADHHKEPQRSRLIYSGYAGAGERQVVPRDRRKKGEEDSFRLSNLMHHRFLSPSLGTGVPVTIGRKSSPGCREHHSKRRFLMFGYSKFQQGSISHLPPSHARATTGPSLRAVPSVMVKPHTPDSRSRWPRAIAGGTDFIQSRTLPSIFKMAGKVEAETTNELLVCPWISGLHQVTDGFAIFTVGPGDIEGHIIIPVHQVS
ncbi:hypothetical protein F5B20DRAFT_583745 [Whalleya microplaca]|nr:hypothetical protein F5B20DRAFT_583745 [Whalleya microplaca]